MRDHELGSDVNVSQATLSIAADQSFSLTSLEITGGIAQRRRSGGPGGHGLDELGRGHDLGIRRTDDR